MKKLFTIATLGLSILLINNQANAQILRYGIKGGVNISNIKNMTSLDAFENTESYTGYHAGIFVGAKFAVVGVQADILYSLQGVSISETTTPNDFVDLENSYINIPIMAKIFFMPKLNFQAGLQYSFLTKSVIDGSETFEFVTGQPLNIKDQFKSGDAALLIGLGLEVSKIIVDLRYNLGVSDNNSALPTTDQIKSGTFQASVGIRFK